jgi:septal ring factor EnvC (AmiA/AmiB activator)
MMRIAVVVALALLVGCATAPVKSEPVTYAPVVSATPQAATQGVDPLAARLTAVEKQQAEIGATLSQLNAKLDAQATELQALRKDMATSSAASAQAEQAMKEAQAAAARAEEAAQKSAKAFELSLAKGK